MPVIGAVVGGIASAVVGSAMSDDNGAEGANDAAAEASRMQAKIAQAQWDRYLKVYAPLEDSFVEESQNFGSQANQAEAAKRSAADVATSFAGVRERLNRTPGANPSSQAYLQEQNRINLAEAAASATGQTGARERVVDKSLQMKTNALNLGKGLPGSASGDFGQAASGLSRYGQWQQGRADNAGAGFSKMVGGVFQNKDFQNWMSGLGKDPVNTGTVSGSDMDAFYQ